MDYHMDILEDTAEESNDKLFSYATEIAIQIALCEINKKAWDLYHAAYNHPPTYAYIKDWAAKKNYQLLGDRTPELHEADYRNIENITSGIEFAAISSPCDRYFTLDDKIRLALDTMMKAYDIPKDDRKATLEKVLAKDYEQMARDMFDKFMEFVDALNKSGKEVWIRQVIIPGVNDNFEYIKDLSQFIKDNIKNVTRVDFLPYHKMGLEKYEKLGIESPYKDKDAMDKIKCDELHKEFMKDFNVN